MRKLLVPIIVPLLFLNFGGFYLLKEWSRSYIKKNIREEILSGSFPANVSVVEIESPETDPYFRRIEKFEFVYQDHLYDIIAERKEGKKVIFLCVHDDKEEILIRNYNHLTNNKTARVFIQLMIHHAIIPVYAVRPPVFPYTFSFMEKYYMVINQKHKPPVPPPELG